MVSEEKKTVLNDELSALELKVADKLKRPSIMVDYEQYAHFLDSVDVPEEYKREFAQTIWSIMFQFASLGFEIHPLQQVEGACGQFEKKAKLSPADSDDLVDCC